MIIAADHRYSAENLRNMSDDDLLSLAIPHDMFDQLRHMHELAHRFGDDYSNMNDPEIIEPISNQVFEPETAQVYL